MTLLRKTITALAFIAAVTGLQAQSMEKQRPNFIIYLGDDIGYEAFGTTGNEFAQTPHIDKLAEQGLVFDRFYGTVAQCFPIRAELFTGLFPERNGVYANGLRKDVPGLKDMGDYLSAQGYAVGVTGKTHFKTSKNMQRIWGIQSNCNASVDQFNLENIQSFIAESQAAGRPFCLFIGSMHAHHPWDLGTPQADGAERFPVPEHYVDTPATRYYLNKHAAEVTVFDDQLAELLAMMDASKITEDTLLLVLSEQGIAMPRAKWSVYEKGNRSLLIAYWKDKIEPGRTNAIGQFCDILPTMIDYAGGENPGLDGFSFRPVLEGNKETHREFAYLANYQPTQQWAIIEDDWKLVWSPFPEKRHLQYFFTAKNRKNPEQSYAGYRKMFGHAWSEWKEAAKTDDLAQRKVEHVLHPNAFELYRIDQDYNEWNNLAVHPEFNARIEGMLTKLQEITGDKEAVIKYLESIKK